MPNSPSCAAAHTSAGWCARAIHLTACAFLLAVARATAHASAGATIRATRAALHEASGAFARGAGGAVAIARVAATKTCCALRGAVRACAAHASISSRATGGVRADACGVVADSSVRACRRAVACIAAFLAREEAVLVCVLIAAGISARVARDGGRTADMMRAAIRNVCAAAAIGAAVVVDAASSANPGGGVRRERSHGARARDVTERVRRGAARVAVEEVVAAVAVVAASERLVQGRLRA